MAESNKSTSSKPAGHGAGRQRAESLGFLFIVGGILIALNVIGAAGIFFRADTTRTKAFTLSEGSRRVARELDDDVQVTAYFTQDLPPPFNATERSVRDILAEYQAASGGRLHVTFVDPDEEEEQEAAQSAGVQMLEHMRIDNGRRESVRGYRGVVFEYHQNRQVIAAIPQDTSGLEYEITTKIKQVSGDSLPVGILSGHDAPTPTKGLSLLKRMMPNYSLREVDANQPIDTSLRAILVVEPHDAVSEAELRNIDAFVAQGGSLGVFGGAQKVALDQMPDIQATPTNSGINRLLSPWGIELNPDIVADAHCELLPLRRGGGMVPVPYPPATSLRVSEEQEHHPVVFRLPEVKLFFTSTITTKDTFGQLDGKVVLASSEQSWALTGDSIDLRIRAPQEWNELATNEHPGPHAVAVALEGHLPRAFEGETTPADVRSRILVVGTASMMRDDFLGNPEQADPAQLAGPMAFVLNAIDWLAQDSDLIAVRAKSVDEPELNVPQDVTEATEAVVTATEEQDEDAAREALERRQTAVASWDARRAAYRFGNWFAIPALVAIFGVVRWQSRQRRKANLKL